MHMPIFPLSLEGEGRVGVTRMSRLSALKKRMAAYFLMKKRLCYSDLNK